MFEKKWSVLAPLVMLVAACGSDEPSTAGPSPECTEGATSYDHEGDECTSCDCVGGAWACETRECFEPACPPQPICEGATRATSWARDPQSGACCRYELNCIPLGWRYLGASQTACEERLCEPGAVIPAGDGCNECTCNAAGDLWQCSDALCPDDTPASGDACGFWEGGCPAGEYCAFDPIEDCSSTDAPSVCRTIPQQCTDEVAPVCGCDGTTYASRCLAAQAGTGIREVGACPELGESSGPCRGELGDPCTEEEYCAFAEGDECGADGAASACKPRPTHCVPTALPVCGCDLETHQNACFAAMAGVGVLQPGACP